MKIKLYYYNAYITLNGEKTNIPFYRLLDKIMILDEQIKFKQTMHGEYSLIKMRQLDANRDFDDRSICFADYRVRKPKLGVKGGDRFEDIKDDVFESTNCFYQDNNKLFIMEYNHYGAKAKHIEHYLSRFLPSPEWGVQLIELDPPIALKDVLDSDDIRYLDIKLDVTSHQQQIIETEDEPKSVTLNVINKVVEAQSHLGGNVAQIYFGNGRKKDNHLNPDEVKKLIQSIDLDSELYISIKVKYYSNKLNSINEIDLKNASVLKDEIEVQGDAWETIADSIEEHFYDYGRNGSGQHRRFQNEIIVADYQSIL